MSLRAAQIVVRAASPEALGEALRRAPRRLVAVLAEGWATLVEPGRADGGFARLLSETLDGAVLALELDGAALSLKLRRFVRGEPLEAGPLPRFADVEGLAWRALRDAGVPAALRLLDAEAVELLDDEDDGGFAALVAEGGEVRAARALPAERAEGDDPPARPDLEVVSAAGEQCAIEVRSIGPGPLSAEDADALAAVEEAQALRIVRHLASVAEEDRASRLSFAYQGIEAPALDRARAARPLLRRLTGSPPPLSHAGFMRACRAAIEAALPEVRAVRAHGLRLELASSPRFTLRAPLAEAWAAYLGASEEPPRPAEPVVDAVRQLLSRPVEPPRTEAFLGGLLPTVALESAEIATGPLAGPLRAALLFDDGVRIEKVSAQELARHGLSFEAALDRAVENVEAKTLAEPQGVSWFDLDEGRVVVFDFADPAGAGRVLSPQARGLLVDLLGEPCLCAVPTRDALLACSMLDEEAIRWLEEEARRRCEEGPFALAPTLLTVTRASAGPAGVQRNLFADE